MIKELRQLLLFIRYKIKDATYNDDLTADQLGLLFILAEILDETIKEYLE